MSTVHPFIRKIFYFLLLTVPHCAVSWTVKIVNATNERITVDIKSSQAYPGWESGVPTTRKCEFIGKQVEPQSSRDFKYKDVNPICIAPCTKSVSITSPVKVTAQNKLTSCSNVIVLVRK